jgi:hypothetical protein
MACALEFISKSIIMKKVRMLLTVAVASLSFSFIHAQTAVGLKGGVNIANLSGFQGNSRVSGHAGVFLHHTINNSWCFQPELLYSGEGQRYLSNGEERTLALDYIQLPLMIQYYPTSQLYLEFGPQVGVLISAQDKGDEIGHQNVKEDFSTAQIALGVGLGFKVTNQVALYGRYNFGLTDVTRFDDIVDHSRVGEIGVAVRLKH